MSIGYTDLQHYSDIADAIRAKSGASASYTPAQMAAAIASIPTGGTIDLGYTTGIKLMNPSQSSPVNLADLDTQHFTTLYQAFNGCSNISSLNVKGWDVSNVTTLQQTFQACMGLGSLDLSGWDTSNVTTMASMFSMCRNMYSVYMPDLDTTNLTDVGTMFYSCNNMRAIIWSQKATVQHIPSPGANDWVPSNATVYVPDDLVSAYQAATNWSVFAAKIAGISDLPQTYKTLYGIS